LQDWVVPVIYEAAPVKLFTKPKTTKRPTITLTQATADVEAGQLDSRLPARPDVGFFGRDETLLAVDRAFDGQRVVLLWALAGAGKTTAAAEFARWYGLTGGVQGPVLFTSFERYLPLARVLDQLGEAFEPLLEANEIQWLTLTDQERRRLAGQLLAQVPVLWIWDNVEPVTGFPAGIESAWSTEEQEELVGFLRQVQDTQAKVLLTSRRDEYSWLGELPARVELPAMPMTERVQLARAIADKQGRRLSQVKDWRPLLAYTQGNPLTVTVLVGQALREGIRTPEQVEAFVARLQAGEASLADDKREGRTKSLGASLGYGFEQAFTEAERTKLALLYLFQGFVAVEDLCFMGDPGILGDRAVETVRGLTRNTGIELLDRAAEVGLLTSYADGYYSIHPALPWYFQNLFTQTYGRAGSAAAQAATYAYVRAMASAGNHYAFEYEQGRRDVLVLTRAQEANLLSAWRLARAHGWWEEVIGVMQGLRSLYEQTGRNLDWRRLVDEVVPEVVDPTTDGPRRGREEEWSLVSSYLVRLAQDQQRDYATAERLQRARVAWLRKRAKAALATDPDALTDRQRTQIVNLAVSINELGGILRQQDQPACVEAYTEALRMAERIDYRPSQDVAAFNLGIAYTEITSLRDLDKAQHWYELDLNLVDEHDPLGRARTIGQLGRVHYERFLEAKRAGRPEKELLTHLNEAMNSYHQALDLTPEDAIRDLAIGHHQVGMLYEEVGEIDMAVARYRDSVRYEEAARNPYGAGQTRYNVALMLAKDERYGDALLWAQAALRDFQSYGDRAADDVARIESLIATIEHIQSGGQG
jgi:hypothetical protein